MSPFPIDSIRTEVENEGLISGLLQWGKLFTLRHVLNDSGQNILDEEWDLCIVLDACRADLMHEFIGEYDFVDGATTRSVGSATFEWMPKIFCSKRDFSDVTYICANPFSEEFLEPSSFARLEEVWKTQWDSNLGTVPADAVTDIAISIGREYSPSRLLVHYMQPHVPFVPSDWSTGPQVDEFSSANASSGLDEFEQLEDRIRTEEQVWSGYRNNLGYALESVSLLLSNFDAERAVITSDHGNAFGEWGFYGHPTVPIDCLRTVPWCVTVAEDENSYYPERYV